MPKPNPKRVSVFSGNADQSSQPADFYPMSEANRAYEEGAPDLFPMEAFVSPEAKRVKELEGQLTDLMQQLEGRTNDLAVYDGTLIVHGFQLTPTGLIPPENMSFEAWDQVGTLLLKLEGSIQWLIGDWIVYGQEVSWGDLPKLAESLDRDLDTLYNYASVSRKVQSWLRNQDLSYNHHRAVAHLTPEQQKFALDHAAEYKLPVAKFRKWIAEQQGQIDQSNPPALPPQLRFKAIGREMDKFMDRDPSKAKPDEKATALSYAAQMRTWLEAYEKKWNNS